MIGSLILRCAAFRDERCALALAAAHDDRAGGAIA